jgi:hypothetical protein
MAMDDSNKLLGALSAPVGDIIAEMGKGIADAQKALDKQVLENYAEIYKENNDALMSLRGMGYRPTWYHIPEAEANLQISLTLSGDYSSGSISAKRMYAAPVNANYKNSYDFELTASSSLRFKIVPVPEPATIEDRYVVPALAGQSRTNAELLLNQLGIKFIVSPEDATATSIVEKVSPAPGSIVPEGTEITLTIAGE